MILLTLTYKENFIFPISEDRKPPKLLYYFFHFLIRCWEEGPSKKINE